jgi:hypothetical protein
MATQAKELGRVILSVRRRVNERFFTAEERFTQLLNDPETARNETQANEFITIAVILSMQDVGLSLHEAMLQLC